MLISLSKKFVFVANLKSASTAIEKALRPHAELALVESRLGKHQSFREIEARFAWMLSQIDPEEGLIFAVIRDPVDYVISLYNSHQDSKFEGNPNLSTAAISFDQFLSEWTARNPDQVRQQYLRFVDRDGRLGVNFLIAYESLDDGLRFVGERVGVTGLVPLKRENESPRAFSRPQLKAEHIDWIEERFADDRRILNGYCNYLLQTRPKMAGGHAKESAETEGLSVYRQATDAGSVAEKASDGATRAAHGALLASQFIRALYRVLLLREPDASGLETYVQRIHEGRPIEEIMRHFLKSQEFSKKHLRFRQTYVSRLEADSLQEVGAIDPPGERQ